MILITPAIRALRSVHPNAHISVVVGEWSKVALEGNPNLDEIIAYPDPWIQNRQPLGYLKLVSILRKKGFDVAYIFHSHPLIHLITVLAGISKRFGFFDFQLKKRGKLLTAKTEWQPNTDRYIADNYLDIARLTGWRGSDVALDFFLTEEERQYSNNLLAENNIKSGEFLVVAPGGGVNPRQNVFEKRWGAAKFRKLCDLLHLNWDLPIVLTGSPQEVAIGEEITRGTSARVINLIGKTGFRHTAGLIQRCCMLICNDSAVMHVAVAFKIPSLAIFGPSNPRSLLPRSDLNQWITSGLDCSPCYCNSIFEGCEHLRCMEELSPESVMERINVMRKQLI